ncbi:MAG: hypothetical protein JW901_08570 [Dehalococcoidia bacterium]|nr:hypothetical protein [Dehalococcoidia bacterium]
MARTAEKVETAPEVSAERGVNFWTDKTPCWEMSHCTNMVKSECPAFKYQFLPCWEIEGTYCKLDDYGANGKDTSICEVCRIYKTYGGGRPIQLKLLGRGINTSLKDLEKVKIA